MAEERSCTGEVQFYIGDLGGSPRKAMFQQSPEGGKGIGHVNIGHAHTRIFLGSCPCLTSLKV